MTKIELIDALPDNIEQQMREDLIKYETSHRVDVNYKPFNLVLFEGDKTIGVLSAYTAFAEIYIDDLWVDSAYRNKGYGRKLLQALESRFEDKGFNNINLVTSAFQAPEFYKKCGYEIEFVRKNIQNPKLTKTGFIKYFKNKNQTQGVLQKDKVYQSYDKMFKWFDEARSRELFEKPYLDLAISYLKPGAKILDLGCGMGEPIGKYFIDQGFDLTGIDGSAELINLASSRFSQAKFMIQDMRTINLKEKFDLIIAWNSFFHLSRDDQRSMFKIFEAHINKQGILMFTSGPRTSEVWSDNGGEMLYHASLDLEEYKKLLLEHNFEIIKYAIEDESCGGACIWVARYAK